jgi:hypothetical protein
VNARAVGRGGHPRLRRSHRDPPGRAHGGGAPALLMVAAGRFTIPGIMCRSWRASLALCAMERRLRTGCCRRSWTGFGASSRVRATEAACAQAISEGVHSSDVIVNILARQRDPRPIAPIFTPEALRLRHAPVADCARYDHQEGMSMERTEVLDMMGELKPYGMKNAYDETLATALKRRHEPQLSRGSDKPARAPPPFSSIMARHRRWLAA